MRTANSHRFVVCLECFWADPAYLKGKLADEVHQEPSVGACGAAGAEAVSVCAEDLPGVGQLLLARHQRHLDAAQRRAQGLCGLALLQAHITLVKVCSQTCYNAS